MTEWGYIDTDGRWAIEPSFEQAGTFAEGLAWARRGGLLGYIDRGGEWVVSPRFKNAWPFVGGLAQVSKDDLSTFVIDRSGAHRYAAREPTLHGVTPVCRVGSGTHSGWGAVDVHGKEVLPLEHGRLWRTGPFLIVQREDEDVVYDLTGARVHSAPTRISGALRHFSPRPGGWIAQYLGEAVGTVVFLDETLRVVGEVSGDRVKVLNDGPARYAVTCDNATSIPHAGIFRGKPSTRYLDENLKPVEYTPPPDEERGIRIVKRGREQVVRHDGQDVAGPYSEAHARVELDEHNEVTAMCVWVMQKQGKRKLWGTLDAKGRPAIEPAWDVREWQVGAAALGELGHMGLVASDGRWIVEPAHTGVRAVGGAPARFCAYVGGKAFKNGKLEGGAWALHAVDGTALTEPLFADVGTSFGDGLLPAARGLKG